MNDYDAIMNTLPKLATENPDNPETIAREIIAAANRGDGVFALSFGKGDAEISHGEYTDVTMDVNIQAGYAQLSLYGSTTSLNEIWNILQDYGKQQTEAANKTGDNDDPLPALTMMFLPTEEIGGDCFAEADMPIMWAMSAEGLGRAANHLRVAFPASDCNILRLHEDGEWDDDEPTGDIYEDIVSHLVDEQKPTDSEPLN